MDYGPRCTWPAAAGAGAAGLRHRRVKGRPWPAAVPLKAGRAPMGVDELHELVAVLVQLHRVLRAAAFERPTVTHHHLSANSCSRGSP